MNSAKSRAVAAIDAIGLGYDLTVDLRLECCKSRLIVLEDEKARHSISFPGGFTVPSVPKSIKCDKGEPTRLTSGVLSFQEMSELFNREVSLLGKIPTGQFNAAFEFSGIWQKDAASTKALAFDGVSVSLYAISVDASHLELPDHVKDNVPTSWDPEALARFIGKYGTHVVVGVNMGGKDVLYVKQHRSSLLETADVKKSLKEEAEKLFAESAGSNITIANQICGRKKGQGTVDQLPSRSNPSSSEDMKFIHKRIGGSNNTLPHSDWCQNVHFEPDVISMSFIPIISLLGGCRGSGLFSHAINLYLRYKPPIDELHQFLEFQIPRLWAPISGELGPFRKQQTNASLQFKLMGPKLYINAIQVNVGKLPVTGLRLYLEGKRSNCLAIHLQHLSSQPKTIQFQNEQTDISNPSYDRNYYEKVQWESFSQICTAPVEADDDLSIVTGAHFEVRESGGKNVLFLRLHFSKVISPVVLRNIEWDGSLKESEKSETIWSFSCFHLIKDQKQPAALRSVCSSMASGVPPLPTQTPKLSKFVETKEMTRGPQDSPGFWVVSGAKLNVEKGKIFLRVRYSLLTLISSDKNVPVDV